MFITIKFYLQILCVAGYLERRNDTPNLNINKYTNYNIIEIYIKVTGSMYVGNIFLIMCLDMYKNLKEIGIIQEDVSKLIIFVNL